MRYRGKKRSHGETADGSQGQPNSATATTPGINEAVPGRAAPAAFWGVDGISGEVCRVRIMGGGQAPHGGPRLGAAIHVSYSDRLLASATQTGVSVHRRA